MSYLRSIHVQKDRSIFKLEELPIQRFAESLGLPGAPKIKFLSKEIAKRRKNASHVVCNMGAEAQSSRAADVNDQSAESADDEHFSEHSSSEEEETEAVSTAEITKSDKVRPFGLLANII